LPKQPLKLKNPCATQFRSDQTDAMEKSPFHAHIACATVSGALSITVSRSIAARLSLTAQPGMRHIKPLP
jgi:hypothetical protein